MSNEQDLLLLDTNVLVQLVRNNPLGIYLQERFGLRDRIDRPLISTVTIGEGLTLGLRFGWGESKLASLRGLFRNLVVIDIGRPGIVERYAEIADQARSLGRALSDNDLWIAATASVAGAMLITTDNDFDGITHPRFRHVWVDPQDPEAGPGNG